MNKEKPDSDTQVQARAALADAEALSALMDNEADSIEVRRLMRRLNETPELLASWKRYQLVQDSLRQSVHVRPGIDLLPGINAALADEALPVRDEVLIAPKRSGFWRAAGQTAIAASVAAMAVIGLTSLQEAQVGAPNAAIAETSDGSALNINMPTLAGQYQTSGLERTVRLDSAARTRLQQAVYQFTASSPTSLDVPLGLDLPAELERSNSAESGLTDSAPQLPR